METGYIPIARPGTKGESLAELHSRIAYVLESLIRNIDAEGEAGPRSVLLCGHAATNIAIGRTLTGEVERTVPVGTCSLSIYTRKNTTGGLPELPALSGEDGVFPDVGWEGQGVSGGWDCVANGDCSFLEGGEERNWWFDGDEDWDFVPVAVPAAGEVAVGVREEAKI